MVHHGSSFPWASTDMYTVTLIACRYSFDLIFGHSTLHCQVTSKKPMALLSKRAPSPAGLGMSCTNRLYHIVPTFRTFYSVWQLPYNMDNGNLFTSLLQLRFASYFFFSISLGLRVCRLGPRLPPMIVVRVRMCGMHLWAVHGSLGIPWLYAGNIRSPCCSLEAQSMPSNGIYIIYIYNIYNVFLFHWGL